MTIHRHRQNVSEPSASTPFASLIDVGLVELQIPQRGAPKPSLSATSGCGRRQGLRHWDLAALNLGSHGSSIHQVADDA